MSRTTHSSTEAWLPRDRSASLSQQMARMFAGVTAFIAERRRRSIAVAELERLDDRMLQDIGIARAEIQSITRDGRRGYQG